LVGALVDKEIAAPALIRLLAYWEAKRGERRWPRRGDIDPVDFPYVLGNVTLIDVRDSPPQFRIRLFGENLARKVGVELTGQALDTIPFPELRDHLVMRCRQIVERGTPYRTKGEYLMDGRQSRHEMVALPLSTDGVTIDMLLIAFWFTERQRYRPFP
jgi:hypothetical protein